MKASLMRVVDLLSRFRFVPTRTIEAECFPNATSSSRREMARRALAELRENGLIESRLIFGRSPVHYLTESGAKAFDVEGGRGVGVRLAEYDHDLAVMRLYLTLRGNSRVTTIMTEREIRSSGPDPASNEWAIPIVRSTGKEGYSWPDLVTVGDVGIWGHEVEWSAKNKQRLRRLMIAYGRSRHYDGGVYYYTDSARAVVESCAATANERLRDAGLGAQIITRPINESL